MALTPSPCTTPKALVGGRKRSSPYLSLWPPGAPQRGQHLWGQEEAQPWALHSLGQSSASSTTSSPCWPWQSRYLVTPPSHIFPPHESSPIHWHPGSCCKKNKLHLEKRAFSLLNWSMHWTGSRKPLCPFQGRGSSLRTPLGGTERAGKP